MKLEQITVLKKPLEIGDLSKVKEISPHLVFVFGSVESFRAPKLGSILTEAFPHATIIGCSALGEISKKGVHENSINVSGLHFDKASQLKTASVSVKKMEASFDAGVQIAKQLAAPDLKAIFVLGQGVNINGSQLVDGLKSGVKSGVILTGGLAGDGAQFKETFTILNQEVTNHKTVALGIYGDSLNVRFGSMGGWKPFGPARQVTKSKANILFEIDGEPALNVYKKYLGEQVKNLPSSALLFPFALLNEKNDESGLIRTILGVDDAQGTLTFAGDIPEHSFVRLMHADTEGLIAGAEGAANAVFDAAKKADSVGIALLISCIGRKIVLGTEVDGEVEACQAVFGKGSLVAGFYSHGEIAPGGKLMECKLHNQTMTITYLSEK